MGVFEQNTTSLKKWFWDVFLCGLTLSSMIYSFLSAVTFLLRACNWEGDVAIYLN
jgi:hypothetical protein